MPYKRDYRCSVTDVSGDEKAKMLTRDLCCDGCAEHCQISIKLDVDGKYLYHEGCQVFYITPVVYAGNVKLYESVHHPQYYVGATCTIAEIPNAERNYRYALALCRKTCKHSKMR